MDKSVNNKTPYIEKEIKVKFETMFLQTIDESSFDERVAELKRDRWQVKKQTSRKEGRGKVYDAELTRPEQK